MLEFNATLLAAMLSFVVFIMIMNAIFYRPVLNIIKRRDDYINTNYNKSKEFEHTAQTLSEQRDSEIAAKQKDCRMMFNKSVEVAQKANTERIQVVKEESNNTIQVQKDELNIRAKELEQSVESSLAGDLAQVIVGKLTKDIAG